MITYYTPLKERPNFKLPMLHRIKYRGDLTEVIHWCKKNCQHRFYYNPGWMLDQFVEFEDDQDAVLFALRWA